MKKLSLSLDCFPHAIGSVSIATPLYCKIYQFSDVPLHYIAAVFVNNFDNFTIKIKSKHSPVYWSANAIWCVFSERQRLCGVRSAQRVQHIAGKTAQDDSVWREASDGEQPRELLLHSLPSHLRHHCSFLCLDQR